MNSDRVFAIAWLLLSVAAGWVATAFTAEFSYEPVGPRAFPLLLCVLMALCSVWLLLFPGPRVAWPERRGVIRLAIMVLTLLAYALVFQWLGFAIATALLTIVLGRLFGGGWRACVATGAVMGISLFFLFDRWLEVTLPIGSLIEGLL
ncbi:tripartite tricarboxylate transporter TctB family protein [Cupriavidus gilardii]|uniref:tripartite tricarboxylate transporter TctB family protein n=1 Tax=Cupriavidus gilardii TaxID=82541 RepID=UPI00157FC2D4|nr:tripartite tricarboxylate transporter TctB family protein [Cupriavidus gilardii]MCT9070195.1 tripartite tricarboxylate transporter TctB family protein [Cupriavidus gilardii]QKS61388.1 tripartite tricarboxylate transporter TctB family protein [Cupriavidus gilardii]